MGEDAEPRGPYDPMLHIEKMKIPTLVVLGEADRMGSSQLSAERWRTGFTRAGNTRAQVVVIDGMGHAATIGSTHAQGGAVMPEYTAAVAAFLATFTNNQSPITNSK
jgi:pimeloyl-ACP methyl ester carboxylesterase